MSRRWLVSLACLSVLIALLAPLTRARGELKVIEASTRFLLDKEPAEVVLAVENSTGETVNAKVEIEIRDPQDRVISKVSRVQSIGTGNQTLPLTLPLYFSKLKAKDRRFLFHRLHYRVSKEGQTDSISEGIVSLSEITPDLFELRVTQSEMASEGARYRARVFASHPITHKPAPNVIINAQLTLEDNDDKNVKLYQSKTTDDHGYALLEFVVPDRFPRFPHTVLSAGGELHVTGKRGAYVTEAQGDVLVDQFPKTLITTDKPLYQPGQVMHLRALIFTPSRRALANQNVRIRINDPEGTTVSRTVAKSSRFGIASTDWAIPDNVRLGDYRISVGVDGSEESSDSDYEVRISRYDLPNFSVSVKPDRDYYLPGQNAEVRVRADYLFGQQVKRGHVRVVRETEREWNYRTQKWDIDEGEKHEGETDADGLFVARFNLAEAQEALSDTDYNRYRDLNFAAYFTDPTTHRTEQRRFDLRVTRESIHVYVATVSETNPTLPLRSYVSTVYADGSPAQCTVNVTLARPGLDSHGRKQNVNAKQLITVRTNRYGVAKIAGARLPRGFEDDTELEVGYSATDSNGRTGKRTEDLTLSSDGMIYIETEKVIYRADEPIVASIKSSLGNETVIVNVYSEANLVRTERVRLHNGRGTITFPYSQDLKNRITLGAYSDLTDESLITETRTILYPRNTELQVNAKASRATYRPGENARVNLSVRASEGRGAESALGVIVLDKAVEERFRTTQEFGGRSTSFNDSLQSFLGYDDQIGGVSMRDLQRLDTAGMISPDLDLVAEVLLNQARDFSPRVFESAQYGDRQSNVFAELIKNHIDPLKDALGRRYSSKSQYPNNEAVLRSYLLEDKIDLNRLLDPWGIPYRPVYSLDGPSDVLTLMTAGADKRFGTPDDFSVERFSWSYFLTLGATIDRAIRQYHERTKGFIRDFVTLRDELSKAGVDLNQLRDRWGEPYRFEFSVVESNYVLEISSGGADRVFADDKSFLGDDFVIWLSSIDYFAETRTQIGNILDRDVRSTQRFPDSDQALSNLMRNSGTPFDSLRDPWGHPYYTTYKTQATYSDRAQIETRAKLGETQTTHVTVTPVTQLIATLQLRSMGPDGVSGTPDDFSLATFSSVLSEQARGESGTPAPAQQVVLTGSNGAIAGQVTDSTAARVPRVKVTAILGVQGNRYETLSDEKGEFIIGDLAPGVYEVQFEAVGFKKAIVTNVYVLVSNVTNINVSLEVGIPNQAVTISQGAETFVFSSDASVLSSRSSMSGKADYRIVTKSGSSQITTPHLREYFPETLLWQPSVETDKQGRARVDFKLADNITTWKLAVLGSTEDGLIGTAETEIKSFQPFFVEHDPPRVLTEGDEISLPVVVRNYLSQPQKVDLDIKPENWFSLLGPARKRAAVAAGDASRETFNLRAVSSVKDGKQRITAIAPGGNDAIEKPVTVHPDGEELSVTDSDIFGSTSTLQLNLPENMISNSNQAELKIYPNLMAHVVESVEAIMQRPYGCGEQVISSTYPSLLLLRHAKTTGEDSPLRARAERYLSLGYSKLLNYRDENGGFTYWGHGNPDVALTAYALRFLTDASELMPVDEDVISEAQEWLIKQQEANGSWAPDHWSDRDSSRRTAVRTAYIASILALRRGEESKGKTDALKRALDYLSRGAEEIDEPYLLASYEQAALSAGDVSRAKPVIEKLATLAHREGSTIYWDLQTNTPFYGWGLAGRVETTALVVQAMTRYCNAAKCESDPKLVSGALLFLVKQKDRYGVWYSTQATVRVLDAMLSLLATAPQGGSEATADIFVNDQLAQTVKLPAAASRLVNPITVDISKFLRTGKNAIRIKRPEGSPFASVQALANFYGPWPEVKPGGNSETRSSDLRLQTKCDKTEGKVGDEITCHVEAERIAFRGYGMMLAEIGIPPGADVDRSSLESAMAGAGWVINQYDVLPDRVVLYLWPEAGGVKFDFKFRPRFGLNAKSAASVLYDYYNPEARAVVPPATFRVREK